MSNLGFFFRNCFEFFVPLDAFSVNKFIMILKYRVSLPGIKGFARVYEVKDSTTLYSLHKQMRADMDFPQDQLVLFKAMDERGGFLPDMVFSTSEQVRSIRLHSDRLLKRARRHFIIFMTLPM